MGNNHLTGFEILFIVGLFVLLPLGVLLINLMIHRDLSYRKARDFKGFGKGYLIIFSFFALSYFIQLFSGSDVVHSVFLICCTVFLLPALIFFWQSRKRFNKLDTLYTYYRHITLVQGETSIVAIAKLTNQRPIVVKNDLLRMMFMGLLEKGFIDEISNQLIFYNRSNGTNQLNQITVNMTMEAAAAKDNQGYKVKPKKVKEVQLAPRKVECSGCGSSSKLQPGETIDCPYCGTSIVYS